MANAKQYNDLNTAEVVNSTDKVALAQADKTELVTTTVSDLANAVGELNQAGALAELSLATSIGKNLLAQRLNEKGATDITPNNTLVEMADKLNSLVIDGQKTNIIGKLITAVEQSSGKGYTFQYCNAKKGQMGDVIILDQTANTLSYVRNGDYNTVADAILAATSTVNLPAASSTSRMRALGISQNEKYVITDIDDNKLHIYEIDKVAGTLTLKHDITTTAMVLAKGAQSITDTAQSLSVTNDGDKYVFWNAQGGTTIGSVSLAKELTASWSSFLYYQLFFIEGTDFVGIAPGSDYGYRKIKYDFATDTVQTFVNLSGKYYTAFFEPRTQFIVSSTIETENFNNSVNHLGIFHRITVYSAEDMRELFSERVQNISNFYDGWSENYGRSITGVQFQVADNADGTFSWICPIYGYDGVLEYNKNTGVFSVNIASGIANAEELTQSSTNTGGVIIFAKNGKALRLDIYYESVIMYGMAVSVSYQHYLTFTDKDYLLGIMQKSASTGKTGVFGIRCISLYQLPELLETGVLDVETTKVEI